jgi:glycogen operon protein
MDLVSYAERHNEANGEHNRDGHSANYSCNHGVEGASADPAIRRQRERQVRNLLATVLLSHGTPMLLAGDEFARSQDGNNNAYCQDNETNWIDWSLAGRHSRLLALTRRFSALRAQHPVLCRENFAQGDERVGRSGFAGITWLHPRGTPMHDTDWQAHDDACLAVVLCATGASRADDDDLILLIFNATPAPVPFTLPVSDGFREDFDGWRLVISTAMDFATPVASTKVAAAGPVPACGAASITIPESCVCVFEPRPKERREAEPRRDRHRGDSD